MNDDLALRLALANKLPDLIKVEVQPCPSSLYLFRWTDTYYAVTPREWDWIVDECWRRWSKFTGKTPPAFDATEPWQTRGVAYLKVRGELLDTKKPCDLCGGEVLDGHTDIVSGLPRHQDCIPL